MADVSRNTVDKLLRDVGSACLDYQDKVLRDLPCKRVECDEIWSFVYARDKNVPEDKQGEFGYGDVWTWTALCADTKLVPCWHVGRRDIPVAQLFMNDLADRLAKRVQLSTDGHKPYLHAVPRAFGYNKIDHGVMVKLYGTERNENTGKYGRDKVTGIRKSVARGRPKKKHMSTAYVERQNLTMRMSMRRFARLSNAHSKKLENHMHAISLHYMYYNFWRIHQTIKCTPAMAAKVTDHVWTLEEIAGLIPEPVAKKHGPYKKRISK